MTAAVTKTEQVEMDPWHLLHQGTVRATATALADPHLADKLRRRHDAVYTLFKLGRLADHHAVQLAGDFKNNHCQDPGQTAAAAAIASYFSRYGEHYGLAPRGYETMSLARNIVLLATGNTDQDVSVRRGSRYGDLMHDAIAVIGIRDRCVQAVTGGVDDLRRWNADVRLIVRSHEPRTLFGDSLVTTLGEVVAHDIAARLKQLGGRILPLARQARATELFQDAGVVNTQGCDAAATARGKHYLH